jgi:hypothetical protein
MTRRSARTTLLPSLAESSSRRGSISAIGQHEQRIRIDRGSCVSMGRFPNRSPRRRIGMTLTVLGKGRKERPVPFSLEMRKVRYRWQTMPREHSSPLLFATRSGLPMNHRNAFRDVQRLCRHVALTVRALRLSLARTAFQSSVSTTLRFVTHPPGF